MAVKKQKASLSRAARGVKAKAPKKSSRGTGRAKKKNASLGGFRGAVLAAFLVGAAVAFFFSWTLYEMRGNSTPSSSVKDLSSGRTGSLPRPGHPLSGEPGQAVKGQAGEALPPLQRGKKATRERNQEDLPPLPRIAAGAAEPLPPSDTSARNATALPYEESLADSLDERIRHVDYALAQAGLFLKLPETNLRTVQSEKHLYETQPYHFQLVEILPGASTRPFISALRGTLKAWAGQARLSRIREDRWAVSLEGLQTHVLQFHPGRTSFAKGSASGSSRRRAAGEPALLTIVIDDLGEGRSPVRRLLALNFPVSFAFWPHGANTREGALAAHAAGREILVHQPMEPLGYPRVKPGPGVLRAGMSVPHIRALVEDSIGKVPYAVGLNNHMGSQFTQNSGDVDAVLDVLRDKGFFMLDSVTHAHSIFYERAEALGIPAYRRNVFLDVDATREKVLEELKHAERIALLSGQAIAIGHPLPATLAALEEWQRLRDPSVRIVPLSKLPNQGQ